MVGDIGKILIGWICRIMSDDLLDLVNSESLKELDSRGLIIWADDWQS